MKYNLYSTSISTLFFKVNLFIFIIIIIITRKSVDLAILESHCEF